MTINELEVLQKRITAKKEEQIRLETKKEELMKKLDTEFGCNSIEEGDTLLDKISMDLKNLSSDITEKNNELQTLLGDIDAK